ncbi:unnamed protein product [Urochloa humidicola]
MNGDGQDHLSALSDDILRRILHFVPFKEAASTSVLSRRWGSLWRSSGAVNLDTRVTNNQAEEAFSSRRNAFTATLTAAEAPVTRLTVRVEAGGDVVIRRFLQLGYGHPDVVTALVSHPAARCVEELLVAAVCPSRQGILWNPESEITEAVGVYSLVHLAPSKTLRVLDLTKCRQLTLSSAPAAFPRLAKLRLPMCSVHTWELQDLLDAAPELATVHLHSVFFKTRSDVEIPPLPSYYGSHFSPLLMNLPPPPPRIPQFPIRPPWPLGYPAPIRPPPPPRIPQFPIRPPWPLGYPAPIRPPPPLVPPPFVHRPRIHISPMLEPPAVCLRCPAATDLVLDRCGLQGHQGTGDSWAMEVDAPRLTSFRYKGLARRFLLRSPAPDMARVDLHFLDDTSNPYFQLHPERKDEDKHETQALVWKFVRNFNGARDVKLKVPYLEDIIAVTGEARQAELLCSLPNVVRLELEGKHSLKSTTAAAAAVVNLLSCCPVVRDLRLNLRDVPSDSNMYSSRYLPKKPAPDKSRSLWDDYSKSVDRAMQLRRSKPAPTFKDGSDVGKHDEVPAADIPGLSGRSFTCLRSSLRRVRLRFRLDTPSCFGVRLLRFFADNAMVLEEMHVDTGNRMLHEHMNLSVERWIVAPYGSSRACLKRKNLTESSWEFLKFPRLSEDSAAPDLPMSTTCFTILPLQR